MSDEELCARVNMADCRFSFQERGKMYQPEWMAPEALSRSPRQINTKAADMWSFAVLLWELASREVPFPDLTPMEAGMKVRMDRYRAVTEIVILLMVPRFCPSKTEPISGYNN